MSRVVTDQVGNNWQATDGGDGQAASLPFLNTKFPDACPDQAASLGSNTLILALWGSESWASIAFARNEKRGFTINLAVVPITNADSVLIRTTVSWLYNNTAATQEFQPQVPLSTLCNIALDDTDFRRNIQNAGLDVDVILNVKLALGTGVDQLMIFNMTMSGTGESASLSTSESQTSPGDTSLSTSGSFPTHGPTDTTENNRPSKSIVIAIAIGVGVALLVIAIILVRLARRRREQRRKRYRSVLGSSLEMDITSYPMNDHPDIVPFPITQGLQQDGRRQKSKPFSDSDQPIVASGPSGSGPAADISVVGEGTEIVRAVRRAGLTTAALLHSLGRMVPESGTDRQEDETSLPPAYARAV
ncbi:hypothetical protein BKA62DRAFT_719872 [Auriculariales sp. MPI-PUGE-AT-0066]|nr:hypothetical protein BKA62DRAFT_719872 [Auriculariales sp. MPI-PUGE-AT-0066]